MGIHATKRYAWNGDLLTIPEIAKLEAIDYKYAYHCVVRMGYQSLEETKHNRAVIINDKIYASSKEAAIKLGKSYQQIRRMLKQKKIKLARKSKALTEDSKRNKETKLKKAWERLGLK